MKKRFLKNQKMKREKTDLASNIRKVNCIANSKRTVGVASRKVLRKQARLLKKEKKRTYFTKQVSDVTSEAVEKKNTKKEAHQQKDDRVLLKRKQEAELAAKQAAEERLKKLQAKNRKRLLLKDNEDEEKNIKKLEKRLKMNKRKSKSIPKVFVADGLDYILDACNSDTVNEFQEADLNDCDSDFSEDFALATGQLKQDDSEKMHSAGKPSFSKLQDDVDMNSSSEHTDSEAGNDRDDGNESDNSESSEEMDENVEPSESDDEASHLNEDDVKSSNENTAKDSVKEDIYGRLVDAKGQVIPSKHYVPPSLRSKLSTENEVTDLSVERLKRQLKGLLNRLSESNMATIVNEIEQLYMRQSRNNMNSVLIKLILEAIVQTVATPERLVQEHCMLVAILHANIGPEVGARMVEVLANKFNELHQQGGTYGEGKECDNLLLILVHLYTFKIIHAVLVYDVLDLLINSFQEKCIELILLILRSAGFTLRKDDPIRLKSVIIKIQTQAKGAANRFQDESRVQFMLDTLLAIRNNNMHKIPNYDVSHREHLRKIVKNFIRKGNYVTELKISLTDLLDVESKGRWWIVGSAWSGKTETDTKATAPVSSTVGNEEPISDKILDLALKLHINTDVRKNIFSIIMTAEDYVDAFDKILKMSLKNAQEKESIHVVLECCLQERSYNPYYAYLLQRFCSHDRKYQMMVQFSVWDKLKELHSAPDIHIFNLSHLLVHLILNKALAISVLKIIQFSDINKSTVRFLRQTLIKLLLHEPPQAMEEIFTRVAGLPKLHVFREGLRLFMRHFMLKNKTKLQSEDNEKLELRIQMAEAALLASDNTTKF